MAPITTSSNEENHQALLDELDTFTIPRPFRSTSWRPVQRRNKNVKQIISEATRREAASFLATPTNASGDSTPLVPASDAGTPSGSHLNFPTAGNITQRLDRLVLERNKALAAAAAHGNGQASGSTPQPTQQLSVTYTNIESAPSLNITSKKRYCDVTGLIAPYTDPKSRLRYHNKEVYSIINTLGQGSTEGYLAARGAHVALK